MTQRKENSVEGSSVVEVRAVVDRIEDGDIAVLSLDDEAETQLDVPRSRLPDDANSDGDHLLLKFDVDAKSKERTLKSIKAAPQARASAEDRIKKMQERLARMSGAADKKDFKL
ncbi:MAG TPA: DUF3006 domain-containing protein [Pyrinomonadaceae bacterium]|jgi:hypothetical protein|nr:DUF3006 domain-containing protein [Pyrinomonadaceae bacterium]